MFQVFTVFSMKGNVFVRERRTFNVYKQINAELDLKGWETLYMFKKTKTNSPPLLVHEL